MVELVFALLLIQDHKIVEHLHMDSLSKCLPTRIPKGPYKLDTAHDWVYQPSHSLRPSEVKYSQPLIAIGILMQIRSTHVQRYSAVIRRFDCYQEQHHLQIKRHICHQFQFVKRKIEISSTFVVRCFLHERKNHCFDDLLLLGQQQFGLDNILQSCFM